MVSRKGQLQAVLLCGQIWRLLEQSLARQLLIFGNAHWLTEAKDWINLRMEQPGHGSAVEINSENVGGVMRGLWDVKFTCLSLVFDLSFTNSSTRAWKVGSFGHQPRQMGHVSSTV